MRRATCPLSTARSTEPTDRTVPTVYTADMPHGKALNVDSLGATAVHSRDASLPGMMRSIEALCSTYQTLQVESHPMPSPWHAMRSACGTRVCARVHHAPRTTL